MKRPGWDGPRRHSAAGQGGGDGGRGRHALGARAHQSLEGGDWLHPASALQPQSHESGAVSALLAVVDVR